jgi:hypothetical protein
VTAQLSLVYRPAVEGGDAYQRQLEVLRKAVEHLTRKEVAWELGVTDQALGDALFERDRKRWAAKWTHIVKAMLHVRRDDVSRNLLRLLVESDAICTPFVVDEVVDLSPEEINAAYERELRGMGDAGKAVIDRIRRKGRK